MDTKFMVFALLFFVNLTLNEAIEIPEHLKAHAKRLHDRCQKEIGVDEALIAQSNNGNLPNDRKLQCYIHCLFQKTGLIDENNIIHLEHMIEILPTEMQEIIERLISSCGTKHGADPCETAYLTVKCYFDADPENSMLI
uniref:OBP20 n=1 Tax=Eupeodes corollae TaxID=290404 RepID=A0A8F9S0J4_9MUSC|nr:OBP20 [Eupeodes corollae]